MSGIGRYVNMSFSVCETRKLDFIDITASCVETCLFSESHNGFDCKSFLAISIRMTKATHVVCLRKIHPYPHTSPFYIKKIKIEKKISSGNLSAEP